MTWNALLEHFQEKAGRCGTEQNSPNISNFAIIGYNGGGLSGEMWAHNNLLLDFPARQHLRAILKNPDEAKTSGIKVGGRNFVYGVFLKSEFFWIT